jgi:hypothetical protein
MNHDHDSAKLCKNHAEFSKSPSNFLKMFILQQVTTIEMCIRVESEKVGWQMPLHSSHQGPIATLRMY